MKILFQLCLLFITLLAPTLHAQTEITCPTTLKSSFELPANWQLQKDTLELTFIGSSVIKNVFSCYYGVGRVALTRGLPASKCALKNSHKNPLGIEQGKVCNGMASDCSLLCP